MGFSRPLALVLSLAFLSLLTRITQAQEGVGDQSAMIHVLNRITFGPRPGDVEMVQKMGLHNYIESQLHPETIDDSAVDQLISQFALLQMSTSELAGLYRDELARGLKKQTEAARLAAQAAAVTPPVPATATTGSGEHLAPMTGDHPAPMSDEKPAMADGQGPIEPAAPVSLKARLKEIGDPTQPWKTTAAIGQLEQAKLVRAVDSQRQLQEVLVDFWGNHFNIDVKKKQCRVLKIADDRDVIRPHIWGRFRDLLEASAKSPAMLVYLDNATNTKPRDVSPMEQEMQARIASRFGFAPPADPATAGQPLTTKKQGGINENYAREIMELHTLGVDGGYTQQDVQEVARCFTGWSVDRLSGEFMFRPRQHDNGTKVVLGHQIPANGGIQDGETVLDILASSPACAHFISRELCQRFVADNPPDSLVERVADVFTQTGGDLRQVTESILTSPEFMSPASYGNKIKSPLEFAVSAVRASGATFIAQRPPPLDRIIPTVEGAGVLGRGQAEEKMGKAKRQSLNWHIVELGQPLFACTPPTGYKEVSSTWVSPGALIERLNFAMALTQQEIGDVTFDSGKILAGVDLDNPEAVLNQCVSVFLQNNITPSTRKVLETSALPTPGDNKTVEPAKLIALLIGSPEFQRK